MITNLPQRLPERIPIEYAYNIKLLLNIRRSIAQRYQTIRHLPTVTDLEVRNVIGLYQIVYALESEYRYLALMPPLTGLPKWAEREVGVRYDFKLEEKD